MSSRNWIPIAVMSVIGSFVLLIIYRSDALPYIICGVICTYLFTRVQKKLWMKYARAWIRIILSVFSSWLIMIVIVVLGMVITHDSFSQERIAENGWLLYILLDKIARGIFFGVFFASIAYVWIWIPMGLLWYMLMKWNLKIEHR